MPSRITVTFSDEQRSALEALCEADLRPPKDQIRYLILAEAQ